MPETLNCSSESNIVSCTWLFSEIVCQMPYNGLCQLGVRGPFRNSETELISLNISNWLKAFLELHETNSFTMSENTVTRGHTWKLLKNHCHCEARLQFFSQRVINRWNSLSQEDVDETSVNAFKRRLERWRRRNSAPDGHAVYKSNPISCTTTDPALIYQRLVATYKDD